MAGEIKGLRELDGKLSQLSVKLRGKVLKSGVRYAAAVVIKEARKRIPKGGRAHKTYKGRLVAPGFARRSIRAGVKSKMRGTAAEALIGVRKEAFYAINFVELGTSRQGKQPWLRPAMESTQKQQVSRLATKIEKEIKKVARS